MRHLDDIAKQIELFIFDVDGILTTGTLYYGIDELEYKAFHVHDGLGIKLLKKAGIAVAIISGRRSLATEKRLQELEIKHVYLGHENKLPIYEKLKEELKLSNENIAYMGDDLPDLSIMTKAGMAITVPDAPSYIQKQAHWTTSKKGGEGAVREACEFILKAQNKLESVLNSYLISAYE